MSTKESRSKVINLSTKEGKKIFAQKGKNNQLDIQDLIPTLVDFWIESSEIVFDGSEIVAGHHFNICYTIIRLLSLLWPTIRPSLNLESWSKLVNQHIHSKFPFGAALSCRDSSSLQNLTKMNFHYSLVALEIAKHSKKESERENMVGEVKEFAIKTFNTIKTMSGETGFDKIALKMVSNLAQQLDHDKQTELLDCLVQFQLHAKALATAYSTFRMIRSLSENRESMTTLTNWMLGLPKQLWELKTKNLTFSAVSINADCRKSFNF